MTTTVQLYINGEFVPADSGATFESINPFNGDVVATAAKGGPVDIDRAVAAARKAFDEGPWPRMTGAERGAILKQVADKLEEDMRPLVGLIVTESGATVRKAKGEAWLSGKHMAYFARLAENSYEREIERLSKPGVSKNLLVREPIGVCGQITPWNFPLQMLIWKIAPALAAGNTVVVKPAEETPAVAGKLAEILDACDIPKGVVNIVTGTGEEAGAALVKHTGIDKIAFTGSTAVGKKIMTTAGANLTKVTLELGGKSANIVFDDADLTQAIDGAIYAGLFHSGQCCTAGTRLLLQEGIHDGFLEKMAQKIRALKLGDPMDKATDIGPLISKKQQESVLDDIETGKKEGATLVTGGKAPGDPALSKGFFVEPTVFSGVENTMTIAREEIFGPVISVLKFKDEAEAVAIANDTPYGLSGGVWSGDGKRAEQVARQLRAGTVWVNEYHLISEKAPFGGYKQSGIGRELGEEGLLEYTETKHIHIDELNDRSKKFWYDAVVAADTGESE